MTEPVSTARVVLFALITISGASGGCVTNDTSFDGLQGFAETHHVVHESDATGHRYHVFVRLPKTYHDQPDAVFPVVYLLDGGAMFPKLAGFYHYLRLGDELPDLILVGISYGADSFAQGNYRASDFTAPAPDRDFWGGAPQFQRFLADELMPRLETRYRINTGRRVLFGQSLGGQFVLYSALADPELFWGRIASNPALHRNLPFFLEHEMPAAATEPMLFVASAEFDAPVFRDPALEWVRVTSARPSLPWRLHAITLAGDSHFSAAPAAFRYGLKWMFESAQQTEANLAPNTSAAGSTR